MSPRVSVMVTVVCWVCVSGCQKVQEVAARVGAGGGPVENNAPTVDSLLASPEQVAPGEAVTLSVAATDADGDAIRYAWSDDCGGSFGTPQEESTRWEAPYPGPDNQTCTVTVALDDGNGGTSTASVAVPVASAIQTASNDWVCSGAPVPAGRVVTSIVQDGRCGALSTYLLSQPRDMLDVCSVSPVPPPYVFTAINSSSNCRTLNTYRLRLAVDGLNICSTSPIPAGFVVDGIQTGSSVCADLNPYHLRAVMSGIQVCNISPIPEGYVITNINNSSLCGLGGKAYTLATVTNGISVCSISPVPVAYVVTAASTSSLCATLNQWVLSLAFDGITVCPFSPVPPNYAQSGGPSVSNCAGFSPAYTLHRTYTCANPQVVCSSGCASTATDPANCGACGINCGTGATCSSGYCCAAGLSWCAQAQACVETGTCCSAPLADCDGNAANGCESNLNTDLNHCGTCQTVCPTRANAVATCTSAACGFSCNSGFANCNGSATDGCESNLNTDPSHCGTCQTVCPTRANAVATCTSSACGFSCNSGFANCNGSATDGCEADLNTGVNNCGACGRVCTPPANATPACTSGTCGFVCNAGYAPSKGICIGIDPPRPLAPLSTARVTSQRPTLRWQLFNNEDGARVQICRDRACSLVEQTLDVSGSSGQPSTSLTAGVHFWRLYGRVGPRIGLLSSATWEFFVGARSASVSTSWGTIADFNGDGYADLAVGAFRAAVGGAPEAGRVHVYYGGAAGLPASPSVSLNSLDGATSQFGSSVVSIGDVNGDGYADLAVGANQAPGDGRVYVYLGRASGLGSSPDQTLLNPASFTGNLGHFGLGLAGVGDANGDGYADLVVSAPYARVGTASSTGKVYVYNGSAAGLATTPNQSYDGPDGANGDFGSDVESIGDVNGDGYADLAISADYATVNQASGSGRVRVYLGGPAGFAANPSVTIDSPDPRGRFGVLGSGGDLNGDGYADLVVGSYLATVGTTTAVGRVRVYQGGPAGISTAPSRILDGLDGADSDFGSAIANAGDVDGDGYDDLVVGVWRAPVGTAAGAGRVYVFLGGPGGVAASPGQTLDGPDGTGGYFGATVSSGGDFNHDGRCDISVGAYEATGGTGRVHVYNYGSPVARDLASPDGAGSYFGAALTR